MNVGFSGKDPIDPYYGPVKVVSAFVDASFFGGVVGCV